MSIGLQIVAVDGYPVEGAHAVFGAEGGSIGRRSDNTLVIPDDSRRVSRVHALVLSGGGGFRIRDEGSFLPVQVNGQAVGFRREAILQPGDHIQIGVYTLVVTEGDTLPTVDRPHETLTFEMLEQRLAAVKGTGVRLTTDQPAAPGPRLVDEGFDATATVDVHEGRGLPQGQG